MNKYRILPTTGVILIALCLMWGQTVPHTPHNNHTLNNMAHRIKSLTIMSYNVENLFDTINNPSTDDDDFTPTGGRQWTRHRYYQKLNHIAQVIARAGEVDWPAIIGLVEIESRIALDDLLERTPLSKAGYRYVMTTGQDPRGINTALLYRPKYIDLIKHREYTIHFADEPNKRSRNLLHAHLALPDGEELHAFVVHLPSRREGALLTEPSRREVCRYLRQICDSLYTDGLGTTSSMRHFIIMGDFNSEPNERPLVQDLGVGLSLPNGYEPERADRLALYNLMTPGIEPRQGQEDVPGSYCYRGVWSQLDQFVASHTLWHSASIWRYEAGSATNYAPEYLRRVKDAHTTIEPYRTYQGDYYVGGYSDHYPIVMRLRRH